MWIYNGDCHRFIIQWTRLQSNKAENIHGPKTMHSIAIIQTLEYLHDPQLATPTSRYLPLNESPSVNRQANSGDK